MSGNSNNIKIDPVNVLWRIEGQYQLDHSSVALVDGVYSTIDAADGTLFYVLYNLDGGATDPAPAGRTAINVAVTTGQSPSVIATAAAVAIAAETQFTASATGAIVDVKQVDVGRPATDPADIDSLVVITVCRRGQNLDLGLLEGDVEFNMAPANLVLTSHQSGVTPRAILFQGFESLEVSTVMQETTDSKLKEIYGVYGSRAFVGGSSTVFGGGTSKQGNNLLVDAARLSLKPVNSVDETKNTNLMLCLPLPDTLTFSGENPKTLSVTWQGVIDDTKDAEINAYVFGDAEQAGLDV